MGYYTDYALTVEGVDRFTPLVELKNDVWTITEMALEDCCAGSADCPAWYGCDKWYSHDEDMLELSRKYPSLTFHLSGNGEEPEDLWRTDYHAGKLMYRPAVITYPKTEWETPETVEA